jgi:hypothetical protein
MSKQVNDLRKKETISHAIQTLNVFSAHTLNNFYFDSLLPGGKIDS